MLRLAIAIHHAYDGAIHSFLRLHFVLFFLLHASVASPSLSSSRCSIALILVNPAYLHHRARARSEVSRDTVPLRAQFPVDPVSRLGASEGASFGMMGRESDFELPPSAIPARAGGWCPCNASATAKRVAQPERPLPPTLRLHVDMYYLPCE
ncbi:hypothetical protein C8R45DRAFT_1107953 [Mycena sanguinolenta]|nr:hypothetical protein C8R45DRAFT_1107953 [Mycena sanguinolenta]